MPLGEPHTMLSPIEKAVLVCCEGWRTLEELQAELWAEFHFDRIPPALAFLRRRRLVESAGSSLGRDAAFSQSELGALVLRAQLRKEAEGDYRPERGLSLV